MPTTIASRVCRASALPWTSTGSRCPDCAVYLQIYRSQSSLRLQAAVNVFRLLASPSASSLESTEHERVRRSYETVYLSSCQSYGGHDTLRVVLRQCSQKDIHVWVTLSGKYEFQTFLNLEVLLLVWNFHSLPSHTHQLEGSSHYICWNYFTLI